MSDITCFPDVPNNKFKQEQILENIFQLLESSSSTKELQDKINDILEKEIEKGTIVLDDKEISSIQDKLGAPLATLFLCNAQENFTSSNTSPAEIANAIISILCKLPKFDFGVYKINLNIDFQIIENLINLILQTLLDILINFISELLNIVVDLCEFTLDIGFGNTVEEFMNFIAKVGSGKGFDSVLDILSDIFSKFNIDFNTGNYIGATDESCAPAIVTIRPASEFLNSVSRVLSTKDICQLLNGGPSQNTLNKIREILSFEYPTLNNVLDTDEKVIDLYKTIGKYIDPSLCLTSPQTYENLCNFNDLESTKRELYKLRGLTEEQINEAIQADNERIKNKIFKVTNLINKLKQNPDSIFEDISTNLFCKNGTQGSLKLSDLKNLVTATTTLADFAYNKINSSYILDCEKTIESNIKFITKRKYIPKILDAYTTIDPETGLPDVLNDVINPAYLAEVDSGNKLFVVYDAKSSVIEELDTINTNKVSNFPDDGFVGDYADILENTAASKDIYKRKKGNWILGIVAEYKERVTPSSPSIDTIAIDETLQQKFSLEYSYNTSFNIQGINYKSYGYENATELFLKKTNTLPSFLTNNTLVSINDATTNLLDTKILQNAQFSLNSDGTNRNLTSDELSSINSSKIFYSGFYESEGPFRPTPDNIKNTISTFLPNLVISSTGKSTEEQVFYELTKDQLSDPSTAYVQFGVQFLNQIKDYNLQSVQNSDYQSFIDSYFIEGLLRVRRERDQFLDKFINDPCSLTVDSFEQPISPSASAIISELVRLFIKTEVIKNIVKDMPFLYTFDPYELVAKDDAFIEFILQTLKKQINDFTTTDKNFLQIMDDSIKSKFLTEYYANDLVVKDPITNEIYDYSEAEFSTDFKYRYFIKQEFINLLVSFRQAFKMVKGTTPINFEQYLYNNIYKSSNDLPNGFYLAAKYLSSDGREYSGVTTIDVAGLRDDLNIVKASLNLILKSNDYLYEVSAETENINSGFLAVEQTLFEQLKQKSQYQILINFCYNYSKYLSFNNINEIILLGKNSYESTKILLATSTTIKDLIFDLYNSSINPDAAVNECYSSTYSKDNFNNLPSGDFIKEMFLRYLAEAPVTIIKLLAEKFDPNISISNQIRNLVQMAASAATGNQIPILILPFVAGLWPVNWGGWGPPITSFGIPYIVVDTILFALALSELKVNKIKMFEINLNNFDVNIDFGLENPYAKVC